VLQEVCITHIDILGLIFVVAKERGELKETLKASVVASTMGM
jgi:hypothetical protein